MDKGLLVVISGPSGTGKGTVMNYLMEHSDDLRLSVSATTRKPREGETHGVQYYFLSREEFEKMIENAVFTVNEIDFGISIGVVLCKIHTISIS